MTFKFNGVALSLQPTEHHWVPRPIISIQGNGHPLYPGVREYELRWNITSVGEFYQLMEAFNNLSGTSVLVVDLPDLYSTGTYSFRSYSGCILQEPEMSSWFNGYYQNVRLLITNIRA